MHTKYSNGETLPGGASSKFGFNGVPLSSDILAKSGFRAAGKPLLRFFRIGFLIVFRTSVLGKNTLR